VSRRLILLMLCFALGTAHAAALLNRRVSDVLDELRSSGYVFIYSTQVVPAQLRVIAEPHASAGVELAREILAQHGLKLVQAAPKIFSIARDPAPPAPQTKPVAPPARVEEVVVQTSRYTLSVDRSATSTFLTQNQLKDLPQLADETLRAVQRLPGSATNGFSSVGPVRGGEPAEMAIVLDGLRLYEPFHLKNFLSPVSLLDARLIDGIEFYSGGFPAIYGDRMSAIVDVRSVRPGQPRYYEIGLNLFHMSALGSMTFADDRGHVLLSGRRSNLGELAEWSDSEFGKPNYEDGFGRLDYTFSERSAASFEFLVSSDAIQVLRSGETQRVRAKYRNVYAWATLDHAWTDAADSRVILSYTDLSNTRSGRIDEPARVATVWDERLFHVLGLRWENSFDGGGLQHRFGAEARRLWGAYHYASDVSLSAGAPFPGSPAMRVQRTLSPEPEGYETLAYWDVRADLGPRWSVQSGLRVDTQTYDGSGDGEQWSPRLSVLYASNPATRWRASWGRFYQAQGINELQVEDGIDRFHPAQYADHFILGFDRGFAAGLDLRIETYLKRYRRLSPRFENLFDPLVLFPEAEYDRVMIDPHTAKSFGVEVLLQLRQRGPWSGWLSYAWSRAEDRIDGHYVARSWDQRHAINLGITWARGPWTVAATNSYHTGWPTTALAFDPAASIPTLAIAERNRSRFEAYNSLDVRLTRVFALRRGVLDVFAEVTNAASRSNPCCVEYEPLRNADGSTTYARDVDNWLPVVPSLGVLWRY
jgi:outer membrane receptor protein involved in Fe transport